MPRTKPPDEVAAIVAQQHLAIDHRNDRDHVGDLAEFAPAMSSKLAMLAAGAVDTEMTIEAEDARQQVHLEAAHHAHHDDQRGDAECDADQREDRDDGDEALTAPGAQVAAGDRAFKGSEHQPLAVIPREGEDPGARLPLARG